MQTINTTTTTTGATSPPAAADELDDLTGRLDTLADQTVVAAHRRRGGTLDPLTALLAATDRITAAAVTLLQHADHAAVIADTGLTIDAWLRAIAHRTGADTGMLLAAAERLADMPAVTAWFNDGTLTWGAVRHIVAATRNLTAAQRTWLDTSLHTDRHRLLRLDADQLTAAVDHLADTARPDLAAARNESAFANRYLTIQPALDGTARIHGTLDPETAAAALTAFDTTPTPEDHHDDSDGHGGGRRQSNVDRFHALCRQRTTRTRNSSDSETDHPDSSDSDGETDGDGETENTSPVNGHGDETATAENDHERHNSGDTPSGRSQACDTCGAAPSTARPSMLIVADIATLTGDDAVANATAHLLWRTTRTPVELTPHAVQRLACDATWRIVLTDGAVPLGVGATHPKVSASLRAALIVRDAGCRFTACHQPADRCDAHHLTTVADGGVTTLANLALLCRAHHRAVHEGGWTATLHRDATMTFTRRRTTLTSQPRTGQHARPATKPPPGRPRRRPPDDHGDPNLEHDQHDGQPPDHEPLPF
ncbi:hypothetical protein BH23ACT10_BH23ACT10_09990 [soil metagenome]